jgi:hypothetical protein
MRQIICDCCGVTIKNNLHIFSYLCHLEQLLVGKIGYIDSDWEPTSGREESKDVCIYCYNRIMIESVKKFKEMHENRENVLKDQEERKKSKKSIRESLNTTIVDELPSVKRTIKTKEDAKSDA